mgnify:CR=1 FL=1
MGGGDEGTTGEMDLESRSNRRGTGVGSSLHEIMTSAASICNECGRCSWQGRSQRQCRGHSRQGRKTREKHKCSGEGTAETSSVGVTRALEGLSNWRHNGTGEDGKDAAIPLGQTEGAGIAGPGACTVVPVREPACLVEPPCLLWNVADSICPTAWLQQV